MKRLKKQKFRWRICFCISSYRAFWHFPAKTLKSNSNIFLGLKRRTIFCKNWRGIQYFAWAEKTPNFIQELKRRPIFGKDWKNVQSVEWIEKMSNFFNALKKRPIFYKNWKDVQLFAWLKTSPIFCKDWKDVHFFERTEKTSDSRDLHTVFVQLQLHH